MPDTSRNLADFVNHGTLPFAGRRDELRRLLDFWHGRPDHPQLRALLVSAQAGAGKSRLMTQAAARIEAQRGAAVHVRLYPESANAILPTLAQALWQSGKIHRLMGGDSGGSTAGPVINALRRLARLRRTALIIEDVHLLQPEPLRDLAAVLDAVQDEPLALICTARPLELPLRNVLERYELEEMYLKGLDADEVRQLWQALFDAAPDDATLLELRDTTLGNALALRTALRNAVRQGAVAQDSSGHWNAESSFANVVGRSVRSLSEGLAIQFTEPERNAAVVLAHLGEVFSREAAALLGSDVTPDTLIFKGLLTEVTLPTPPLAGLPKSAHPPIAFTHSLVHRQLLESAAPPDPLTLLHVIAAEVPLYSVLPYTMLMQHLPGIASPPDAPLLTDAIEKMLNVAFILDETADWTLAEHPLNTARVLLSQCANALNPSAQRLWNIRILSRQISYLRRVDNTPEYAAVVKQMMQATDEPLTEELAPYRLEALERQNFVDSRTNPDNVTSQWDAFQDVARRFPAARRTKLYIHCLRNFAITATTRRDMPVLRTIEEQYNALIDDHECSQELKDTASAQVGPTLLYSYSTPEEYTRRVELYRELEEITRNDRNSFFYVRKPYFLETSGQWDALIPVAAEAAEHFRERGLSMSYVIRVMMGLWAESLVWKPASQVLEEMNAAVRRMNALNIPHVGSVTNFVYAGMLLNDPQFSWKIIDTYRTEPGFDWNCLWDLFLGRTPQETDTLIRQAAQRPDRTESPFGALIAYAGGGADAGRAPALESATQALAIPALHWDDVLDKRAVILLTGHAAAQRQDPAFAQALLPHCARAMSELLGWLAERRLNRVMDATLATCGAYMTEKDLKSFTKQSAAIAKERTAAAGQAKGHAAAAGDTRIFLSMIGRIGIRTGPDDEPVPPRTQRMRAFLGLMVANKIVAQPVPRDEFMRMVEIDPDGSRQSRDTFNSAVYRLREYTGSQAIITEGELPAINTDIVRVDLLEIHDLLSTARRAARRNELMRAAPALQQALLLLGGGGQVIFPALYDSFFEAMREDFENRLRGAVLDVAGALLREGAGGDAQDILGQAFRALPDDEEIGGLYCQALKATGNHAEAELIRARLEAAYA